MVIFKAAGPKLPESHALWPESHAYTHMDFNSQVSYDNIQCPCPEYLNKAAPATKSTCSSSDHELITSPCNAHPPCGTHGTVSRCCICMPSHI